MNSKGRKIWGTLTYQVQIGCVLNLHIYFTNCANETDLVDYTYENYTHS